MRSKAFRVISKHNFLLYTARHQSSSTYKFIRKISLQITIIIFNTRSIFFDYKWSHRLVFCFLDNLVNIPFLNIPPYNKSLTMILWFIYFLLDIFNDCSCFVWLLFKNIRKIHQIIEPASHLTTLIEMLPWNEHQKHRTVQV